MGLFSFFTKKSDKIKEFQSRGGLVIDVRSPAEFKNGHLKGSKNIPITTLDTKIKNLEKEGKPLVFCCASGMRSAQAHSQAQSKGMESMNGGSWGTVQKHWNS
jgi:phage shock protein E